MEGAIALFRHHEHYLVLQHWGYRHCNRCGFPSASYAAHTIMNHLSDYGSIRYGGICLRYCDGFVPDDGKGTNALVQKLLSKVGGESCRSREVVA